MTVFWTSCYGESVVTEISMTVFWTSCYGESEVTEIRFRLFNLYIERKQTRKAKKPNEILSSICKDTFSMARKSLKNAKENFWCLKFLWWIFTNTRFFISNTFLSNARLKLEKYQASAKQNPEPDLLLFKTFAFFIIFLSSKHNRRYSKKYLRDIPELFCKKVFLEISQNSQENTWVRVSSLKKRLWYRCFPVNFAEFLRTPFFKEHLSWLLL